MKCPFCAHTDTQVKDSRPSDDYRSIRRRRECQACGRRFTTFETFQVQQVLVTKRDGSRQLFDREKLLRSVRMALNKRPVKQAHITKLIEDVEQLMTENARSEITSAEIGDMVMARLKKIDPIGHIRYASVYMDFDDPDEFLALVQS